MYLPCMCLLEGSGLEETTGASDACFDEGHLFDVRNRQAVGLGICKGLVVVILNRYKYIYMKSGLYNTVKYPRQ